MLTPDRAAISLLLNPERMNLASSFSFRVSRIAGSAPPWVLCSEDRCSLEWIGIGMSVPWTCDDHRAAASDVPRSAGSISPPRSPQHGLGYFGGLKRAQPLRRSAQCFVLLGKAE